MCKEDKQNVYIVAYFLLKKTHSNSLEALKSPEKVSESML